MTTRAYTESDRLSSPAENSPQRGWRGDGSAGRNSRTCIERKESGEKKTLRNKIISELGYNRTVRQRQPPRGRSWERGKSLAQITTYLAKGLDEEKGVFLVRWREMNAFYISELTRKGTREDLRYGALQQHGRAILKGRQRFVSPGPKTKSVEERLLRKEAGRPSGGGVPDVDRPRRPFKYARGVDTGSDPQKRKYDENGGEDGQERAGSPIFIGYRKGREIRKRIKRGGVSTSNVQRERETLFLARGAGRGGGRRRRALRPTPRSGYQPERKNCRERSWTCKEKGAFCSRS